jgi:hypothetical protein
MKLNGVAHVCSFRGKDAFGAEVEVPGHVDLEVSRNI